MNTNNTVPFQWALIEQGYTPICRNGEKPEQLVRFEGIRGSQKVRYLLDGTLQSCDDNGFFNLHPSESKYDLLLLPPIEVKYLNVYEDYTGMLCETIERANESRGEGSFICTLRLTYQNGELINKEII